LSNRFRGTMVPDWPVAHDPISEIGAWWIAPPANFPLTLPEAECPIYANSS
jgi:hypothetical protein